MAIRWAIASGNFSSTSTWNSGATLGIPTAGDDIWPNGFTVSVDVSFTVNSLNNTVRGRQIATPQMTSNILPSPFVAAASTINGTANNAWNAFDRNYSTTTGWATAAGVTTGWVSMDFGSGNSQIIDGYTIFGQSTVTNNPNTWQLQGSADNSAWTTLHAVTGSTIPASGTYSIASIGNPLSYRYYRLNVTANGGGTIVYLTELELYNPGTSSIVAGGSFNFNTGGVTATITSTTAAFSNSGATNLILVTASTGTVTINFGGPITTFAASNTNGINYTGSCNLSMTATSFNSRQDNSGNINVVLINKTSTGTITLNGDVVSGNGNGVTNNNALSSTAGDTIVNGNVRGFTSSGSTAFHYAIFQTGGALTVNGNVIGGGPAGVDRNRGIAFGGTLMTINGNVTGGINALAIVTSGTINNINGNVTGGTSIEGIISSVANIVNVTGTVTASATAPAITMTNLNGQVYLNGNMVNNNGKVAIFSYMLWIDQTGTTQAQFFTSGGASRTLYSEDTFPNLPPESDTRKNTVYGPGLGLTGSLAMPAAADAASGVIFDNGTTGTALFTTAQLLSEITTSSDPVAVRLRNAATPEVLGELMEAFKK